MQPYDKMVCGFVVPKSNIDGLSLGELERVLGFRTGRLRMGAIIVQLNTLPKEHEIEYFGDTRASADKFDEMRNKSISREALNKASFGYFTPDTKLVKVIPIDDPYSFRAENMVWPSGHGAMQFKIKDDAKKTATVLDVVTDYPMGLFKGY